MCMEFWDGWFDDWGGAPPHDRCRGMPPPSSTRCSPPAARSTSTCSTAARTSGSPTARTTRAATGRSIDVVRLRRPARRGRATRPRSTARSATSSRGTRRCPTRCRRRRPRAPSSTVPLGASVRLLDDSGGRALGDETRHEPLPTLRRARRTTAARAVSATRARPRRPGRAHDRRGGPRPGRGCSSTARPSASCRATRTSAPIVLPAARGELEILVEDQGRVDYGARIGEHKGLIGRRRARRRPAHAAGRSWPSTSTACRTCGESGPTPSAAAPASGPPRGARLVRRSTPQPTCSSTPRLGQGPRLGERLLPRTLLAAGPQRTLFVPGPVLRAGRNELVVLEFEVIADPAARFVAEPSLGPLED